MFTADQLRLLRDAAAAVVHEFAWKKRPRGRVQYWLPDGKEDIPGNRLYGQAAQRAARSAEGTASAPAPAPAATPKPEEPPKPEEKPGLIRRAWNATYGAAKERYGPRTAGAMAAAVALPIPGSILAVPALAAIGEIDRALTGGPKKPAPKTRELGRESHPAKASLEVSSVRQGDAGLRDAEVDAPQVPLLPPRETGKKVVKPASEKRAWEMTRAQFEKAELARIKAEYPGNTREAYAMQAAQAARDHNKAVLDAAAKGERIPDAVLDSDPGLARRILHDYPDRHADYLPPAVRNRKPDAVLRATLRGRRAPAPPPKKPDPALGIARAKAEVARAAADAAKRPGSGVEPDRVAWLEARARKAADDLKRLGG